VGDLWGGGRGGQKKSLEKQGVTAVSNGRKKKKKQEKKTEPCRKREKGKGKEGRGWIGGGGQSKGAR